MTKQLARKLILPLVDQLAYWNVAVQVTPNLAKPYIQRGMTYFKMAQIRESIADFEYAQQLSPDLAPYLWQKGLSYYYVDRFVEAAQQFKLDLSVNSHDAEETLWLYLSVARDQGVKSAQQTIDVVWNETRPVLRQINNLYLGRCNPDTVLAMGREQDELSLFYAYLYLGLYYEVNNEIEQACKFICMAAEDYPQDDYMWYLSRVHGIVRGWLAS